MQRPRHTAQHLELPGQRQREKGETQKRQVGGLLSELMEHGEFGVARAGGTCLCIRSEVPHVGRLPREVRLPVPRLQLRTLRRSYFRLAVKVHSQSRRVAWRVSAHLGCGGVAATGQRSLRTLGGGAWHRKALTVPVPHGIVS